MSSIDLLKKFDLYTEKWMDKQAKLSNYVDRWLNSDVQTTAEDMQQLLDTTYEQITQLKEAADKILLEYYGIKNEEVIKANPLRIVNSKFTMSPEGEEYNDMPVVGVYLSGKTKTVEEKEEERQKQIRNLKSRIIKKEIGFVEAEKLLKTINDAYGYTEDGLLDMLNGLSL